MRQYRLSKHPLMGEAERKLINEARDLMPLIRKFIELELGQVEKKLDSETLFELPAYNERVLDLVAQRRTLKKLHAYFNEVDHAE